MRSTALSVTLLAISLAVSHRITAQSPEPMFKVNAIVSAFTGGGWAEVTILERNGTDAENALYRVAPSTTSTPGQQTWVSHDVLRPVGTKALGVTYPKVDVREALHRHRNSSADALLAARKKLVEIRAREKARSSSPYDPAPVSPVVEQHSPAVASAPAPSEPTAPTGPTTPTFPPNSPVEIHDRTTWKPGKVIERNGTESTGVLYRIAYDGWDKPFFHEWVSPNRLRPIGDTTTPAPTKSIGVKVSNDTPAKALLAARKELAAQLATPSAPSPTAASNTTEPIPTPLDLTSTRQIDLTAPPNTWSFIPPPTTPVARKPARLLHTPTDVFDKPSIISHTANLVLIAHTRELASSLQSHAEIVDLSEGLSRGVTKLPPDFQPIGLTPSGQHLLALREAQADTPPTLSILTTKPPTAAIQSLITLPLQSGIFRATVVAAPDPDTALLHLGDSLIALSLSQAKPLWHTPLAAATTVTPSPDHQTIALLSTSQLLLLNATTGQPVASLPTPGFVGPLAWQDTTLYAHTTNLLASYNLTTGQPLPLIGLPKGLNGELTSARTPTGTLPLIGSSAINPAVPAIVATIAPRPGQRSNHAGPLAIIDQSTTNPFNRAARPGPQNNAPRFLRLQSLIGQPTATPAPPLDLTTAKVAIDLRSGDPAHHPEIRASLIKQLTALGATHDDTSPLKLILTTADGKTVERTYTLTGQRFGQKVTRTFTERITTLTLEDSGQPLWQQHWTKSPPMFVSTRPDQSFEQALDEADQPDPRPAASATLPAKVIRPPTADLPQLTWN